MSKAKKDNKTIDKKAIHKAVSDSSKLEGLSFERAKKNHDVIKLLKSHGRAFSL